MPTNQLITNQNKFLHEVFHNILPSSQNLLFLVGYFYFSGFEEVYENLRDKHLRILVGMDIEMNIRNKIKEFELIEKVEQSRGRNEQNREVKYGCKRDKTTRHFRRNQAIRHPTFPENL
ncbi:MAG TPA: hypothetical protein VK186_21270 [Candidatus Deferrimicrobium sp.]|nr:hypothetical protein [Candidatus Deferrimicrobium sp.]